MKEFLRKVKQAVSGRLMVLRKKVNKEQIQKYASLLRGRLHLLKNRLSQRGEQAKSWLLAATAKVRQALSKDSLRGYYRRACDWAKKYLNREALKSYALTAAHWLRELPKQLTWENIKKWFIAAWRWLCNLPATLRELRKNALLVSCALLALWLFLGTTTSMAWLTYTTPAERNSFQVGEMKLEVDYRNDKMSDYAEMTENSRVFNDEALYEPGYTQVVYFRVKNGGNVDFDYQMSVRDFKSVDSVNVYGDPLHLPEYLRFGIVTASTEPELTRKVAQAIADKEMEQYCLGEYSQRGAMLAQGAMEYAALIVCMPESIGNDANYLRGHAVPQVSLGVTVYAQQAGTMDIE